MQINFQDGVDSIYDACVAKGSTPASQSLSDVIDGIMAIPSGISPSDLVYNNLTAANIKSGTTVSITDGSTTLKSVTGTYVTSPVLIGTYTGGQSINVSSYKRSTDTVNNFMVEYYSISSGYAGGVRVGPAVRAYLKSFAISKSLSGNTLSVSASGVVMMQKDNSGWSDYTSASVTVSYRVYHI
jgi:hypothetical protein